MILFNLKGGGDPILRGATGNSDSLTGGGATLCVGVFHEAPQSSPPPRRFFYGCVVHDGCQVWGCSPATSTMAFVGIFPRWCVNRVSDSFHDGCQKVGCFHDVLLLFFARWLLILQGNVVVGCLVWWFVD